MIIDPKRREEINFENIEDAEVICPLHLVPVAKLDYCKA